MFGRNAAHTENAVHRRQMQNNHKLLPSTPPSPKPATPTVTSPPPPTMTSPAPTPSEPFGTSSAPDGSASPSISAPAPSNSSVPSSRSKKHQGPIIAGAVGGTLVILVSIISIYICKINKVSVNPWATGLSGQLQKAFVTGMSFFLVK
jgi:hypothetical protein